MRVRLGDLRRVIRRALREGPAGPAVAANPTDVKGFYPYETERGIDIHSFWYKSPGRAMGTDGDPGRPEDAEEYIGFKTKGVKPEDTAEEADPEAGEEAPPAETEELDPA